MKLYILLQVLNQPESIPKHPGFQYTGQQIGIYRERGMAHLVAQRMKDEGAKAPFFVQEIDVDPALEVFRVGAGEQR
jgi:hypothetical protein